MEKFFILCGGVGNRLKCLNVPKALAPIPKADGGMETILSRILRLLYKYQGTSDTTLCLGWEAHLFDESWPNHAKMITYDVANPTGAGQALKEILTQHEASRYTIFLGDVIWSPSAMNEWMAHRLDTDIVFYHDHHRGYSETYALSIHASVREALLKDFDVEEIPALPGERWFYKINIQPFKHCRLGGIEKVIDDSKRYKKKRIYAAYAVNDIDLDTQYNQSIQDLLRGKYEH